MAVQKNSFQKKGRGNEKMVHIAVLLIIFLLFENGKGVTNDIRRRDYPVGGRSIFDQFNVGFEKEYQNQPNTAQCSKQPTACQNRPSWPNPPETKIQDYLKESRVIHQFQKKKYSGCSSKLSLFQEKINIFPNTNFDAKIYFPGSIIRMEDQTNYQKSIVPIYVEPIHRKPFLIQMSDQSLTTLHTINSNERFQQVFEQQMQVRIDGFNGKPIDFYFGQGAYIQNILRGLKLPSKILDRLGLLADDQFYNYQHKNHSNCKVPLSRTVIVMNQNLLQAKVVRQNKSSSLFDQFLLNSGIDVIGQKISQGLLDDDDHQPYFVMNSQYGRLLILSVLENENTAHLTQKLMTNFKNLKVQNRQQFFNILQELAENPLTLHYVGGLNPDYYRQTKTKGRIIEKKVINVKKIFSHFTTELIKNLQPFNGFMYNSNGVMRTNVQTRVFPTYNCTIQLVIQIKSIEGGLIMMLSEQINRITNPKQLFNVTHPGTYAITLFARDAFRLKFLAKGREQKGYSLFILKKQQLYTSQAQFSILINGQKLLDKKFRAQRSTIQYHPFSMVLDPQDYEQIQLMTQQPDESIIDPFSGPF